MEELPGYKGESLRFLRKAGAVVGDVLEVKTRWGSLTGTLVPRYLYGDGDHVVLKLKSGYNVGLNVGGLIGSKVVSEGERPSFSPPPPPEPRRGLPRVLLLSTGGTIASRIDYRTGAVHPVVTAAELHALVPELSEIANINHEILFNVFSENMTPDHWSKLARRIAGAVKEGFGGIVVTHGTDTLGYTAAAMSFALKGVPIPVILVGAQRSPDRPSSDAPFNLIASVSAAATADFSGVYVAMHMGESDDRVALYGGTRVRKNHTSRRDAFVSIGGTAAAVWGRGGAEYVSEGLPKRGGAFRVKARFDPRVALLKFYPSMPPAFVRAAARSGARAIIFEGTGLGHVNREGVAELRKFVARGGLAFMTSQCINGRVDLEVYDTGRYLLHAGVLPLEDMLSETALVKAMWALGNAPSAKKAAQLMRTDVAGEIMTREFPGKPQ